MARTPRCAFALVLDVASHMNEVLPNEEHSAFYYARQSIISFLERKIFAESKDEVALIIFGTSETANNLYDAEFPDFYNFIGVNNELGAVNWQLVNAAEMLQPSYEVGDFVEAIVVAVDHIKSVTEGRKTGFAETSILVFSNLAGGTKCQDQVSTIIESLNAQKFDLRFIGLEDADNTTDAQQQRSSNNDSAGPSHSNRGEENGRARGGRKVKDRTRLEAENIARKMVKETEGENYGFCEAYTTLRTMQSKKVNPTAWRTPLEIAPGFTIPTQSYIRVRKVRPKSWKKTHISSAVSGNGTDVNDGPADGATIKSYKEFVIADDDGEEMPVDENNLIKAYRYGSSLVQVNEALAETMKLHNEKSLKLISCCPASQIAQHLWLGDGNIVIIADSVGGEATALRFSALVRALAELNYVAIVRRVYNKASAPKVACLVPEVGDSTKPDALYYVEVPFEDEISKYEFATLPVGKVAEAIFANKDKQDKKMKEKQAKLAAHRPNAEHLAAVDAFIDAAMLPTTEEDEDADEILRPEETRDPYIQHFYRCIRQRILHPDLNTPLPPASESDTLFLPEFLNTEDRKSSIKRIEDLYSLVDRKGALGDEPSTSNDNANNDGDGNISQSASDLGALMGLGGGNDVAAASNDEPTSSNANRTRAATRIGHVAPVEDFVDLVRANSIPFEEICEMLVAIIYTTLGTAIGSSEFAKCQRCMEAFRRHCIDRKRPDLYNRALRDLQKRLPKCLSFFAKLIHQNLGLITVDEAGGGPGAVTAQEAQDFAHAVGAKDGDATANTADDELKGSNARDLLADL